jgi:hypothetical protein
MRALLQDAASAFTAHSTRERLRARLQQEFERDEVRRAARVRMSVRAPYRGTDLTRPIS